ncbi:MAG: UPF0175 family protein [Bryobacterales bacterium]|nr:UPF0175 family protein [Bryobacterales bacterium]
MNISVDIPDDIGRSLAGRSDNLSRAVLEALAAEGFRAGAITTSQVQKMLGLGSRRDTEAFLRRAEALHDSTANELEREIAALRGACLE